MIMAKQNNCPHCALAADLGIDDAKVCALCALTGTVSDAMRVEYALLGIRERIWGGHSWHGYHKNDMDYRLVIRALRSRHGLAPQTPLTG